MQQTPAVRQTRMFLFLVGVMRVLGLFPYRLDTQPAAVTLSKPLLAYSLLLAVTLKSWSIYKHLHYIPSLLSMPYGTQYVVESIMDFGYVVCGYLIPLYFLLRGRRLATALASLLEFHDKQLYQLTENKLDKQAICQSLLALFLAISCIPSTIYFTSHLVYSVLGGLGMFYELSLYFIHGLFYHALFKLLSLMLSAAFTPLEKVFWRVSSKGSVGQSYLKVAPWGENTASSVPARHTHSPTGPTRVTENKNKEAEPTEVFSRSALRSGHSLRRDSTPSFLQQEADVLVFARRSMIFMERVEATVSGFLAPLICVMLLLECIMNVTFMTSIQSADAQLFVTYVIYTGAATLRIYLLLEAPESYRRKCAEIRENLRHWSLQVASPSLLSEMREVRQELAESRTKIGDMFGLFHVGRHCILPAVSFMVTYLVILTQFRISEVTTGPSQPPTNTTTLL